MSVTRSLFYGSGQRETTFWEVLPGHTAGGTAQVGGGGVFSPNLILENGSALYPVTL